LLTEKLPGQAAYSLLVTPLRLLCA